MTDAPLTLEQRVYALESNNIKLAETFVELFNSLRSLHGAVFALGVWMQQQTGDPPGERPRAN